GQEELGQPIQIDELTYTYDGNRLLKVADDTNNPDGFKDGTNTGNDYTYDTMGNMLTDQNKGITNIKYNHLNLPTEVTFNTGKIKYTYDAAGTRMAKKVEPSSGVAVTTDYLGGFQYENNELKFFHQPEGFVQKENNQYIYHFIYKDHLGNNRLTYADLDGDGEVTPGEIIEENNYYPFGLRHKGYNELATENPSGFRDKFGGKELNDELGFEVYDFGARNYDPTLGRWMNIDPLAEEMRRFSPYNYAFNNPIFFIDPDGMAPFGFDKNKLEQLEPIVDINETLAYEPEPVGMGLQDSDTVIITGKDAEKATKQLNKSSSLKITRNKDTGVLSAEGKAKTDYDKALKQAIDDPNITINLKTVDTEVITIQDGIRGEIYVGANGGSVKNADGSVDTYQYINMNYVEIIANEGIAKQEDIISHEVNESYIAAQHNGGNNKVLSANGEAAYLKGHNTANNLRPTPYLDGFTNTGLKYLMIQGKTIDSTLL